MIKSTFTILALAAALALSSCEKKYTCVCVYPNSNISTSETTYKARKKADAEDKCSEQNTAARNNDGSCALK